MKNNIIMWQDSDEESRKRLVAALNSATAPIREAMNHFEWEGEYLTCGPDTLENHKEHWRNLYFYLSGYGDCDFGHTRLAKKRPVSIPTANLTGISAKAETHNTLT